MEWEQFISLLKKENPTDSDLEKIEDEAEKLSIEKLNDALKEPGISKRCSEALKKVLRTKAAKKNAMARESEEYRKRAKERGESLDDDDGSGLQP
jgi:hypothetical protein